MISLPKPAEVVVIGAAGIDVKGRPFCPLVRATSNPGKIKISVGGAARNIAENLARLGVRTVLLTAVGNDGFSRTILQRTAAGGVDTSRVLVLNRARAAVYLAVNDEAGSLDISIDDMRVINAITPQYIARHEPLIAQAKMVVIDANISSRAITTLLNITQRHRVPICMNPVSVPLAEKMKPWLDKFAIIIPNASEAEVLSGVGIAGLSDATEAAQRLVAAGVEVVIITLAEDGLCYATSQGHGHIPAIRCSVVDSTGAGDALTGAVVYGLVNGFSVDEAVRLGVSAAAMTLMSQETVCPELSLELLYETMTA